MNPSAAWRIVAEREISTKLRDKTFLASTAFMLVLVVASMAVPALVGSGDKTEVAVVGSPGAAVVDRADQLGGAVEPTQVADAEAAEEDVRAGEVDVALLPAQDGYEVVGDASVDTPTLESLREALTLQRLEVNAEEAGVTLDQLAEGAQLTERLLDPAPLPEGAVWALTFGFAMVFYITAISFGMVLAQSVVQEKQSRIVEILAAAIPVRALLAGKVVGNTIMGLGQVLLLTFTALVGLRLTGRGDILAEVAGPAAWFALFFVLGFVALAGVWAVAGSVATRNEDLQQTTLPAQALLFIPFFAVLLGSDRVIEIASFVPIASTIAMPVRMISGDVPVWEAVAAAGLVLVVAAGLIVLAASLYERSLLQTQRTVTYRELLRGR
ncbi:MAG TPA: ABC transporter permease [Nocardioidaceae bacterium]|nr:ABC transporter permease [Nocardioidaceae bacterium]